MDYLKVNPVPDQKEGDTIYYGVYTPNDSNKDFNSTPNVYQDKLEALKVAKKNKKSRFKAFQFYHEAVEFTLNGSECPNNNKTINGVLGSFSKLVKESAQTIGEKASPFKGPQPQELIELRKAIESGNYKFVKETIWQNPRYLVGSGDTPSILQEGPRYNALHVAAKSKNAEITELILSTITNVDFIKLLYGDDNQQNAEDRVSVLLDLYLNTPNKGLNESPLHFASKHGAPDVVEILVSYPQCDKTLLNKYQKSAAQIICERAEGENLKRVRKKIEILLQDSYYVPVYRAEDESLPPSIGEPFSPTSPPVLNKNPLSPRLEIHAYAGPMDKKGAEEFRKVWKTPPRSLNSNFPTANKQTKQDLFNVSALRYKDLKKGLERIGKKLANKYDVNWKEYWPFLDSFIDIASTDGLNLLEEYLSDRNASLYKCEKSNQFQPILEEISSSLSKSDPLSPIANLCSVFSAWHINDSSRVSDQKTDLDCVAHIDKACQVFANRVSNDMLYNEDGILSILETEIKQLEQLIMSYMDDERFVSVNFQKMHCRLGSLVGRKLSDRVEEEVRALLCSRIESVLDSVTKSIDCFSSDDESHGFNEMSENHRKPTMYRKQLICLVHYILNFLGRKYDSKGNVLEGNEGDYLKDWEMAEECACVYHVRKLKRNSLSRSGSFKNSHKLFCRDPESVSKKLYFDEGDNYQSSCVQNGLNSTNKNKISDDDSSEEEEFYTPPSSPDLLDNSSDSEDEFNDTELPKYDVFIEGEFPTRLDSEVYNALVFAECKIDFEFYPNVYKWLHTVSLYSAEDRESWPSSKEAIKAQNDICKSPHNFNVPSVTDSPKTSTPSKSWLRVTGANSPGAVFKSYSAHT